MLNWLFNPTNEKGFQEDDDDGVVDPAVLPSLFPNSDNLISIDDWSGRTLSSLITRALPSGQIQPPKVIIMGAQSSGKTLLIISMVFYYLQHVPSLTPDMGERLLSIFRTGTGMVTKRPIEIHLLNTDTNTCKLKLELSGVTAEFPSAEFDAILTTNGNTEELHMAPLRVYICAKELPNIDFLDMPGITAEDKQFVDAEGITRKPCTVRTLAKSFAEDTNSTIVLVENSILSLDLDNCQLLPLLKEASCNRKDLLEHCILVVSQCDKLVEDSYEELRNVLEKRGEQFKKYQFRHVVGVINKFGKQPEPHSLTFTEFYSGFKHTKLKERQRFSSVFGAKGREAEDKVLSSFCTTPALFRSIDSILLMQLKKNFEISFQTLKDCLTDKLSLLYAQCPIPSRYYLKGKERRKSSILRKISFGHLIEEFVTNARRNMGSNLDNFYLDNLDKWFKKLQILSDSGAITFNIVLGKHAELEKYRQWIEEVKKDWLTVLQQVKVDNLNIFSYQSLHAPCRFPELQRAVHCALSEDLPPVLQNLEKKGLKYVDEVVHGQYVAAGEDGMRAAQHSLRILLTWVVDDVGQLLRGAVDSLTSRIDTAAVARLLAEDKAVFARRVEIYFSIGQLLMQLHTLEDCLNGSGTGEGRMDYICSRLLKGYMQLQEVTESLPFDVEDVIWAVYVQSRTSKQRGKKSSFEQTATEELLKLLKVKTDLSSRALSPSSHLPLRSCNKPQNTANNFVDILGSNDDEYGESSSNCDSKFESSDDREESDMEVDEGKDERSEFPLSVVQNKKRKETFDFLSIDGNERDNDYPPSSTKDQFMLVPHIKKEGDSRSPKRLRSSI